MEAALAVIRPFLKDKTRERIKMHGSNLSTLHEVVARDILPPELGGEGPTFNPLTWYHILLESSQMNAPLPSYCITQTSVYSKSPISNDKPKSREANTDKSKAMLKIAAMTKGSSYNDPANNQLLNFNDVM